MAKEGEALAAVEFKTADGDVVPNGDMSGWSKKQMTTDNVTFYPITYPNAEGENFWDSGNNMFLEQYEESGEPKIYTPLCYEEEGAAVLMPRLVLGAIFAPGNMYTGQFVYEGFSGTAYFGQPYEWTARPRALKVRCKATVGTIDKVGSFDPDGASYKDQQDRSYIFVAVVNWTAQHGVSSGMTAPTGMWNPAETSSVDRVRSSVTASRSSARARATGSSTSSRCRGMTRRRPTPRRQSARSSSRAPRACAATT